MTNLEIALIIYSIGVSIGMWITVTVAFKAVKARKEALQMAKESEEKRKERMLWYEQQLLIYNQGVDQMIEKHRKEVEQLRKALIEAQG